MNKGFFRSSQHSLPRPNCAPPNEAPKRLGLGNTAASPDPSRLLEMLQIVMAVTDGSCRVGQIASPSGPSGDLPPSPDTPKSLGQKSLKQSEL